MAYPKEAVMIHPLMEVELAIKMMGFLKEATALVAMADNLVLWVELVEVWEQVP